ncbi:MAG: tetratricopeptide repeat protein [Aquificaceae bacterium]
MKKFGWFSLLVPCLFMCFQLAEASQKAEELTAERKVKIRLDEELLKLLITSLLGKGDLEEAYNISKKAMELYPESVYWLDLHAKICLWTNRAGEVFETYRRLVLLDPSKNNVKNFFHMALASNRFDIASQLIREHEYLREDISIKDLVYMFNEAGEIKELIKLLEDLYEKKKDPNLLQNLAQIFYNYGDIRKAFEYMNKLENAHGFTSIEEVNLYSDILFVMRRYREFLAVLKRYFNMARDENVEYFERLSDLGWFLRDTEASFSASKKLENIGKARLVDYVRLYMVLYSRVSYEEASIYAKKGYERYRDFYLLTAYVQSLRMLNKWEEIARFLSDKEKDMVRSHFLISIYFKALYRIGKKDEAKNFLKLTLKNNFSEELLAEAIYNAVENSDGELALYVEKNYGQLKDKLAQPFAVLYLFMQNSQSALELLRTIKRESIEDLLLYADVLSLYGREDESARIRLSILRQLSQNIEDTYRDPNKLTAYLRVGIQYLPASQIEEALKVAQKTLTPEVYEDIYYSYLISKDYRGKLYYMANIQDKKLKPWMDLNIALFYDDRDWQKELLEKHADILPIRDRVEALRRTGELKKAGYYAYKGLEENREDYLLYKQFRDLVVEYYSKLGDTLSYTSFGDVNFLKNEFNLRYYLTEGTYFNYESVSWFKVSNKNPFLRNVKNAFYNGMRIRKAFDRKQVEFGVSHMSSLESVIGALFAYKVYLPNKTHGQVGIALNQPSYESIYMLQGGMKDVLFTFIQHSFNSRLSFNLRGSYEKYKSQDNKNIGKGFINYTELYYKLRFGYPDYTLRLFTLNTLFNEKSGPRGVINRIAISPDPDVLPKSYNLIGLGFSFGFDNRDNYVRVIRPFLDSSITLDTLKKLGIGLSGGIGGALFGHDNLSLGISHTTNFMRSTKPSFEVFIKYLILY